MSRFVEVVVAADADEDDCLVAAEAAYIGEHPELRGYDLSPRWTDDDDRETVTLVVPAWACCAKADAEHDTWVDHVRNREITP